MPLVYLIVGIFPESRNSIQRTDVVVTGHREDDVPSPPAPLPRAGEGRVHGHAFPRVGEGTFHWHAGLWLAGLMMACLGCGSEPPLLYCGAGIKPPVEELVEQFQREHGVAVVCDYRGSEVLLSSVTLTGKGDLYMPGDAYYVELAEKEGLVASKKTVCYFVPVILVRAGNPKNIRALKDLTREDVKVGLGDPQFCAVGRTSAEIFQKNGIPEEDVSVTFRSPTVNELGNHIELGSLDAVIVWDAIAAYLGEKGEIVRIPPEQNVISTVVVAILKSSQHPELSAEFVEFITSEQGRQVFKKHHYTTTLPGAGNPKSPNP